MAAAIPLGEPVFNPPIDGISRLRFSAHSETLLASSWDGSARLYDAQTLSLRFNFAAGAPLLDCCLQHDGAFFTGGLNGAVKRFDVATSQETLLGAALCLFYANFNSKSCICVSCTGGRCVHSVTDNARPEWPCQQCVCWLATAVVSLSLACRHFFSRNRVKCNINHWYRAYVDAVFCFAASVASVQAAMQRASARSNSSPNVASSYPAAGTVPRPFGIPARRRTRGPLPRCSCLGRCMRRALPGSGWLSARRGAKCLFTTSAGASVCVFFSPRHGIRWLSVLPACRNSVSALACL